MKSRKVACFVVGCALKAAFLVLFVETSPADAQTDQCHPSGVYCTPFVGCIEETGEIFWGETYGRQSGPLVAVTSYGAVCEGTWQRAVTEIGAARFECDDGRRGISVYDYFDETSGTAVGEADLTNGQVVRFWAGWNIEAYFNTVGPQDRPRLACKAKDMLLS